VRGWAAQFLADPRMWAVFLGLVGLAAVFARRSGWKVWGTLLSAAAIITLTLVPAPGQPVDGPSFASLADCIRVLPDPGEWWRAAISVERRGERVGNVLMFVPICFFAVLATRRPVWIAVLGVVAPVVIEVSQVFVGGGRDCAADDWVNNATGALLGVSAGVLALRLASRFRPRPD
jgi:hypothetical protein